MNNKTLRVFLAASIALLPAVSHAQEIINTPPIFIRPSLVKQIDDLTAEILGKQKQIKSEEAAVQELAQQNLALVATVEAKKREANNAVHLFSDYEEYDKLKSTLRNYDRQIGLRDAAITELQDRLINNKKEFVNALRMAAAKDIKLKAKTEEIEAAKDEFLKAQTIQEANAVEIESLKTQLALAKDSLAKAASVPAPEPVKVEVPVDHAEELEALKTELTSTNEELAKARTQADLAKVEAETAKLAAGKVSDKDAESLKALQEELASVKKNLSEANARVAKAEVPAPTADNSQELKDLKTELASVTSLLAEVQAKAAVKPDVQEKVVKVEVPVVQDNAAHMEEIRSELKALKEEVARINVRADQAAKISSIQAMAPAIAAAIAPIETPKETAALDHALEAKKEILTEQKQTLDQNSSELQANKLELARTKQELLQAKARYEDLIKGYDADVRGIKQSFADEKDKLQALKTQEFKEKVVAMDGLSVKLAEQTAKLTALQADLKTKDDKLVELEGAIVAKDKEIVSLKEQLVKARDEVVALRDQLAKDDDRFAELRDKGQKLKDKIREQTELINTKDDFIAEIKGQHVAALENVDAVTQAGKEETAKLRSELEALGGKLQAGRGEVENLQSEMQQASVNTNERLMLRETLAEKRRERILLLGEKVGVLSGRMAKVQDKFNGLTDELNKVIAAAEKQDEEDAREKNALKQEAEAKQGKIADLEKTIKAKDNDREEVYRLVEKFKSRLKETSDITNDQDKSIAAYRAQVQKLEDDLHKAKGEAQGKEETIAGMGHDFARLQSIADDTKKEAATKDLSLALVQANLDKKTVEQETLAKTLNDQVKKSSEQIKQLTEKLTVAETQLKQVQDGNNDDLARVQDMLKASREEIIVLNGLLKDKKDQVAGLQKDLDVNAKEFTEQNTRLESLKKELEKQQAKIAALDEDLQWKDKEIARLKLQVKDKDVLVKPVAAVKPAVVKKSSSTEAAPILVSGPAAAPALPVPVDRKRLKEELGDARQAVGALKEELRQIQSQLNEVKKKSTEEAVPAAK